MEMVLGILSECGAILWLANLIERSVVEGQAGVSREQSARGSVALGDGRRADMYSKMTPCFVAAATIHGAGRRTAEQSAAGFPGSVGRADDVSGICSWATGRVLHQSRRGPMGRNQRSRLGSKACWRRVMDFQLRSATASGRTADCGLRAADCWAAALSLWRGMAGSDLARQSWRGIQKPRLILDRRDLADFTLDRPINNLALRYLPAASLPGGHQADG